MTNKSAIKILVLDDDHFTLKLLASMLGNSGYTAVSTCDNGRAALVLVDNPRDCPDLILLDLNMPEMDGVEFVRYLVEHRYNGSLILFSGEDEQMLLSAEKLVRVHKIPVLGHLRKPVKPEGLGAMIERWTPSHQGQTPGAKIVLSAEDLRAAIANGELVNYYQPGVTATGRVVGDKLPGALESSQDGMVLPRVYRCGGIARLDQRPDPHGAGCVGSGKRWRKRDCRCSCPSTCR